MNAQTPKATQAPAEVDQTSPPTTPNVTAQRIAALLNEEVDPKSKSHATKAAKIARAGSAIGAASLLPIGRLAVMRHAGHYGHPIGAIAEENGCTAEWVRTGAALYRALRAHHGYTAQPEKGAPWRQVETQAHSIIPASWVGKSINTLYATVGRGLNGRLFSDRAPSEPKPIAPKVYGSRMAKTLDKALDDAHRLDLGNLDREAVDDLTAIRAKLQTLDKAIEALLPQDEASPPGDEPVGTDTPAPNDGWDRNNQAPDIEAACRLLGEAHQGDTQAYSMADIKAHVAEVTDLDVGKVDGRTWRKHLTKHEPPVIKAEKRDDKTVYVYVSP